MDKSGWGKEKLFSFLKTTALVAGFFSFIVCVLILLNYLQLRSVNPLNSLPMEELIRVYRENPGDDTLKKEIRELDLLIRKAFFTQQWHIQTGGYLLAAGVLVFFISLSATGFLKKKIPVLGDEPDVENIRLSHRLSRTGIAVVSGCLIVASLVLLFFSSEILASPLKTARTDSLPSRDFPDREEIFANWPNFRGPFGNAAAGEGEYPVEWDGNTGENILWKTELPREGFNSPIVWGSRVFLSGADEEVREVYCLDTETGSILWEFQVDDITRDHQDFPDVSPDTGYAAPGMATDGRYVFALFATGFLVCLDFDGHLVWEENLGVPANLYGHSSSLITYQDILYVQYDHEEDAALIALDTGSGKVLWKTERDVLTSWASPLIIERNDDVAVVLNANPSVAAYDAFTGKELWKNECMMGEVAPSPASGCGYVFAVNQFASLVALDPGNGEIIWEFFDDLPNVPSPLAVDPYIFLTAHYGVITALDCHTGEVVWVQEFDEGFYSSPVLAGGHIYIPDMEGKVSIFTPSDEYVSVGTPQLYEETVSTPAFSRGRIYIRGETTLFCIGEESEKADE